MKRTLCVLVACVLLAAGCGKSPDPAAKPGAASSSSASFATKSAAAAASGSAQDDSASPVTLLYDAATASAEPLSGEAIAARTGWNLVPEDDLSHKFTGDVVLRNDRLIVVVRQACGAAAYASRDDGGDRQTWVVRQGCAAEVYSQTAAGPALRATVAAVPSNWPAPTPAWAAGSQLPVLPVGVRLSSVRIVENTPAAVSVEAEFTARGNRTFGARYRLTAGQAILEVRPAEAAGVLSVYANADYVVVPDFFGNDRLFDAASLSGRRTGLPAENFFLSLLDGGSAMMMCTWKSPEANADAFPGAKQPDGKQFIDQCRIEFAGDKPVWLAFMEGENLWHSRRVTARELEVPNREEIEIIPDWRSPFAAKWRVDYGAQSWRTSSITAEKEGTEVENNGYLPSLLSFKLDADRAAVQVPSLYVYAFARHPMGPPPPDSDWPVPLVFYPIDRISATPLDAFTPMDVLRNTLGVGPCQYILESEGLGSDDAATPDVVVTWLEKRLQKPFDAAGAAEIKNCLGDMVAQVARTGKRVAAYGAFAREMHELTIRFREQHPSASALGPRFGRASLSLYVAGSYFPKGESSVNVVRHFAEEVSRAIDNKASPAYEPSAAEAVRAAGLAQERSLAECRMAVRELKQAARDVERDDAASAEEKELARKIRAKCEEILTPPRAAPSAPP